MHAVPPDSASYRDARPGAEARRDDLLRHNREILARQSLELRRIYVRRLARSWSGLAVIAGSFAVAVASASSVARGMLEGVLPGRVPAVASDLLLLTPIAGALVYFVARALAEERFTRAMVETVRPGANVFDDVDRLSVSPTAIARGMAERYRARAVAAVIGASAIAAPLICLVIVAVVRAGAYQSPAVIESIAWHAGPPLAQIAVASIVLGLAWLSIGGTGAANIRSRARRSAALMAAAGFLLAALGAMSDGQPEVFMWVWAAWSAGAAAALMWASATVELEDEVADRAI